jgi:hypothetical protein
MLPCGAGGFGVKGAFDPVRCGSTGPDAWHLKYAELHRRILSGRAPQRYIVAQVRRQPRVYRGLMGGWHLK